MKNPFNTRLSSFDADAINDTIQRALTSAGIDTASGPMRGVTEQIRRALSATGVPAAASHADRESVIDVEARVVPTEADGPGMADEAPASDQARSEPRPQPGRFETHHFRSSAGSRAYKLYVPAAPADAPRPMIVMLHGCTQSADDFAAGTQMNRQADEHGFLVVYPEQPAQANPSKCWNWFRPEDQSRGAGEPAVIAGIVGQVAERHGVDPRRIFVAGLSAGAAMAVVLGESYPELFAGVGVHSGLPYGSAHDIPSAMAAMKGGRSGLPGLKAASAEVGRAGRKVAQAVPVIVFHGDRDHTVQHSNGGSVVQQARQAHAGQAGSENLRASTHKGVARGGRRFSRTVHADAAGQPRIESWTVHGAGHAWSGGDPSGSYTDATGPDASREMVRFFMSLPRAGSA